MRENIVIEKAEDEAKKNLLRNIVASEYADQGYVASGDERLVRSNHYDGNFGIRFAAVNGGDGTVLGTIALAIDSPDGLPMDALYHDELLAQRNKGLRLAEVGQFAVMKGTSMIDRMRIVSKLFSAVLAEYKVHSVDAIVITVNPKHDRAYTLFGFTTFADSKPYPAVGGALAVPKMKSLSRKESDVRTALQAQFHLTQ